MVQVMQVSNAALIGDVSGEIPCRPTLCSSTTASDLHHALKPWMRTDLLRNPGAEPPPASQLLGLAADSHPSNKLLVTQIAQDTPESIPILDLMCLGHQLSLAADDVLTAMRKDIDIINPMFATQKLMQQLQARDQLYKAIDLDGDKARVIRGVPAPPELKAHAESVLGHTLGDGIEETLFTVRGPGRSEFDCKDAAIVADFMKMFNGDWKAERWEHYCCISPDDRRLCCRSVEDSKTKMQDAFRAVTQTVIWDKLSDGTKKWGENNRRAAKTSFPVQVHRTLPRALKRAWRVKASDGGAGGADTSEERIDDAMQVKGRKRKKSRRLLEKQKGTGCLDERCDCVFSCAKITRPDVRSRARSTHRGCFAGKAVADCGWRLCEIWWPL